MNTATINNAIKPFGMEIIRGRGYQYFLDLKTGDQIGESVMTCHLNQLPLERWVEEAAWAWGQREAVSSPFPVPTCRDILKTAGNAKDARAILRAAESLDASPLELWELANASKSDLQTL